MAPNLQRVAEIGADGRVYVALGLVLVVAMLAGVAFFLGRAERESRR